ncbi:tRNA lysidine(34) synthetase TilS [Hydromonas duriensis]|uniref:tRNA(Ile)-lysidine synthase n=1 Tax=Hydromonas duriensis TaxID=1527608 RepID=A0A4R6Y5Q7_9BURK|nr:tRNA lysidine(34) synthetase TilS [Hydromonas duriensis]TDR30518.1 tRNA(Ile)-lysidine synthase [Hydromonas duriensis]
MSLNKKSGEDVTAFLLSLVLRAQTDFSVEHRLAVAVSGGVDSMALLDAAQLAAKKLGRTLYAFHVNHGLQQVADEWQLFVQDYCQQQGICFDCAQLKPSTRQKAQSIEDWARQGRYAALTEMANQHAVTHIWLAQHEDDQIETHLLQKYRGAGARGLAAMPSSFQKDGLTWQRPWLSVSKAQIEAYATQQSIEHVTDPSNTNPRFARNALRLQLKEAPLDLMTRFEILSDIGAAQTQLTCETEWADSILAPHVKQPRIEIGELACLNALMLKEFNFEQQCVLIRHWFATMHVRMPSRSALHELLKQINITRIDQHMCWQHPDGIWISRFRDDLIAVDVAQNDDMGEITYLPSSLHQYGVDVEKIHQFGLITKARQGGERIRLHPQRPSMSLKKAYLEAGIAPILRSQLPLVYCEDRLVYAAGLGMNVDACVLGGVPLLWKPAK